VETANGITARLLRDLATLCLAISSVAFEAYAQAPAAGLYYVHVDHLNTPRAIYNAQQQLVWRWDQIEPFGSSPPNENPSGLGTFECNIRFPGQYFDKETDLAYNYFRDFDPGLGRYAQSDPIGLRGGLNAYAYVGGSPISKTDPRGSDNPGMGPYDAPLPPNPDPSLGCSLQCYTWQQFVCVWQYSNCRGPGPGDPDPTPQRGPRGSAGMGGERCLRDYYRCSEPYDRCRARCECKKSGACC